MTRSMVGGMGGTDISGKGDRIRKARDEGMCVRVEFVGPYCDCLVGEAKEFGYYLRHSG